MSDLELIRLLSSLGVRLWVEGEALKYSAPRGALTEALREQLRARKDALRTFLSRAGRSAGTEAPAVTRLPRGEPLRLSFGQERLWFLHQLDPADPSYAVPLLIRFEGPFDASVLRRALAVVVNRHEVLRTTFALAGDHPVAVIHETADLPLPETSFAGLPEAEREAAARRDISAEIRRPFDLAAGPVVRLRLFELAMHDHVLLLNAHHIVTDARTGDLLRGEIDALYAAFAAGLPSPLGEVSLQYADYAAWQRRWLTGSVVEEQLAYWKARLADAPRTLDLPFDRPRPRRASHQGEQIRFAVGAEVAQALDDLAQREGATLFMVTLAAFAALLARWSGQADLCVGSPIAGRSRPELESVAGFFVNTLVLRVRADESMTFRELLGAVRDDCLGAYAHQELPFERLVQELDPAREPSRTPLFQVMFSLQAAPTGAAPPPPRRGMAISTSVTKFDLTLTMRRSPSGLSGSMELATDLFERASVERMIAGFQRLLAAIAVDAGARLWELPLLDEAARIRLVGEAPLASPARGCLHQLFEAQADETPDAIAVTFEGGSLTYRELDRRSNQVASALRRRGVQAETVVGLCLERSLELIVGLIGILKAGGAYLPLDPDQPAERLAFVTGDARASVVLTQSRVAATLTGLGAELLFLDAGDTLRAEPADRTPSAASPASLAYVIYTSGSTGKPKGVLVAHHNVARLFDATEPSFRFDAGDVWTQFHSHAFDFSVWEIWGALLHGGRLVVVPYWVSRAPDSFYQLLVDERVTVLDQTPSAFRQLVLADERAGDPTRRALALRWVIFGGEALDVADLRPFWDRHGDEAPRLVNMYGITETTVHVTLRPLGRADLERPWSSPIGVPLADLRVYVLDAHRQPVPVGVVGEMFVGGAGVARGYLGRPALTAERFVDDPFFPGHPLYRTGDRARRLPSGELEYLGRTDLQVKIRGHRIELGEIEAALGLHAGVREAVVIAREDTPGDKRLVAYVVAKAPEAAALPAAELRAFARERLPEYMLPAAFVALPSLPLTSNGKLDRRALPAPEASALARGEYVVPRGPVEEAIAGVFADVLGVPPERVGAHDGFFDLGGHSLLATMVAVRLRSALGVEVPLRAIFESPTPAGLALHVSGAVADGAVPVAPAIRRAPVDAPPVLSFAQERLWFLDQLEPGDPSYVVPLAMRHAGAHHTSALKRALTQNVRPQELLRTCLETRRGAP